MKKTQVKKLKLQTQTLQTLTNTQLTAVVGGSGGGSYSSNVC
ncbi:MAG: hypothetical protein ACT4TC_09685 [Myxococcaceae bacterium]